MSSISDWMSGHSLLLLLSAGTLFSFLWLMQFRGRLNMKWYAALPIAICHTLVGVICVKAFAFMETGFDSDSLGNMSLFGGVFFMPLLYLAGAKLTKRKAADVCDAFTGCMILMVMCARVNCILSGCCTGLRIPGTQMRFPTRETEVIYYVVMLLLLIPRVKKDERPGSIYPLYMATYGVFRFINEFFRTSSSETLFHLSHVWAAIAFVVGLSIYAETKARNSKGKKVIRK